MVEYASTAKGRGIKSNYCRCRWRSTFARHGGISYTAARYWRTIKSSNSIDGWDSVLSILQMPNGIPVATVALNGAKNAGILAATIIGALMKRFGKKVEAYKKKL